MKSDKKTFCDWPDCFAFSKVPHEHINEHTVKFVNEETRSSIQIRLEKESEKETES